jgi:hypothetical protein
VKYRDGEPTKNIRADHNCCNWTIVDAARYHGFPIRKAAPLPGSYRRRPRAPLVPLVLDIP